MDCFFYLSFNFILYSFLGWILEEIYCFFTRGYFKKEGFLKGPFKPMYGFALSILIYCYKGLKIRGITLVALLFVVPTFIEFASGYILKKWFKKVYWDYSNIRFNFMGLICVRFSLYWGVLSLVDLFFVQNLIDKFYFYYDYIAIILTLILGSYLCIDLFITIKENLKGEVKYSN